jgi:hypothetical protein
MLPLPSDLAQIVDIMGPFTGTWAIAGGWAIDLWLGRQTRTHADVDIAIFRDEQSLLRATFADWQFSRVVDGKLQPWPRGEVLRLPEHEIHASTPNGTKVELLLNERRDDVWLFRRDTAVELPMGRVVRRPQNVPALAPEIVLLYKSKNPRATDDDDFAAALPSLDDVARGWLKSALTRTAGYHQWLQKL